MRWTHPLGALQVGDRPGDTQDALVAAGAEPASVVGKPQMPLASGVETDMAADQRPIHLRVAGSPRSGQPRRLAIACGGHSGAGGARGAMGRLAQLLGSRALDV